MKGSEKQIKWAGSIRDNMDFSNMLKMSEGNAAALKTINYIMNIDHSSFWIDNKNGSPDSMIRDICTRGLRIRGDSFSHTAKVNQATGEITITWTEIVSDGKGGHKETKTGTV